jgi:hypothetical protein
MENCSLKIRNITIISASLASFIISVATYIFFRDNSILWIKIIDQNISWIHELRLVVQEMDMDVPDFIVFNLQDGLFLFSFTTFMLWIWDGKGHYSHWVYVLPGLLILHECLQSISLVSGTFDVMDIIIYLLATIATFNVENKYHEKVT